METASVVADPMASRLPANWVVDVIKVEHALGGNVSLNMNEHR